MLQLKCEQHKNIVMKTHPIRQEILLVTNSTFSNRKWCEKDSYSDRHLSHRQQLEEACWNGLDGLLPEIVEKTRSGKRLLVWHIRRNESFLQIELCESPALIQKDRSINAY